MRFSLRERVTESPLPIVPEIKRPAHSITALARVSILETGSKGQPPLLRRPSRGCLLFSMQAEQSIVVDPKSPGGINSPHGLILFDGVCVLCSRGCGFVSKL